MVRIKDSSVIGKAAQIAAIQLPSVITYNTLFRKKSLNNIANYKGLGSEGMVILKKNGYCLSNFHRKEHRFEDDI